MPNLRWNLWFTQYLYLNGGDSIVALGYGNGGEQFVLDTGAGVSGALRFFVRNATGVVSSANSSYVPANDGLCIMWWAVCDENGWIFVSLHGRQPDCDWKYHAQQRVIDCDHAFEHWCPRVGEQ